MEASLLPLPAGQPNITASKELSGRSTHVLFSVLENFKELVNKKAFSRACLPHWPACSGNHYNVQMCGGEMGESTKQKGLHSMKRGRIGDVKEERNSLLRVAGPVT